MLTDFQTCEVGWGETVTDEGLQTTLPKYPDLSGVLITASMR
jgi:hypothetical protein